jgi:hypothetical protein
MNDFAGSLGSHRIGVVHDHAPGSMAWGPTVKPG